MKRELIVILGLAGILTFAACSSGSDEVAKQESKLSATSTNGNNAVVTNGTEFTGPRASDSNIAGPAATDPLVPPGSPVQRKLDEMRKAANSGPKVDPAVVAAKNAKPAPDNSTFASYLGDEGYEIRTFKSHPQLLKVEKKTTASGQQTLKVFLRGGRVIEMPGHKINPLSTAPASLILLIAGVQTQPAQTGPTGPVETKKQD
jgi:hypothetical protein